MTSKKVRSKSGRPLPKFMVIYKCSECGHESGYSEHDRPVCRVCDGTNVTLISKKEITPEVMAERLKATTDNMMKNLQMAFEQLGTVEGNPFGDDKDAEAEFLKLMAKAKKLRDDVQGLELKDPNRTRKEG
jgi:hypothetical protein